MSALFDANATGGELGGTKGYAARSWLWLPNLFGTEGPHAGWLTLTVVAGKTLKAKPSHEVYLLTEADGPAGCRAFVLVKEGGPDAGRAYTVTLDGRAAGGFCDCEAAKYRLDCKHLAGVLALVRAGEVTAKQAAPAFGAERGGE